jgi:hypothetical protein
MKKLSIFLKKLLKTMQMTPYIKIKNGERCHVPAPEDGPKPGAMLVPVNREASEQDLVSCRPLQLIDPRLEGNTDGNRASRNLRIEEPASALFFLITSRFSGRKNAAELNRWQ